MIFRKPSPFQAKLIAYFWLVSTIAFLCAGYFYKVTINKVLTEEAFQEARDKLDTMVTLLRKNQPFDNLNSFYEWLKENGLLFRARFTYIEASGKVLADSEVAFDKIESLENHLYREEIQEALKTGVGKSTRYSATIKRDLMYVAKRCDVSIGNSSYEGFLRIALISQKDKTSLHDLFPLFVASFSATFIFVCVMALWITKRLYSYLNEILRFADDIAKGNIRRRLIATPNDEFPELLTAINSMADAIESQLSQLTETKETLTIVLQGMGDGVLVLDKWGKIRMANPYMVKHIIGEGTSWEGRYPIEVIPSIEFQDAVRDVIYGKSRSLKLKVSLRDEESVYDVTIARLERERDFFGVVAVFHDVSEMMRIEKVRRDFVANVSHALRTPLTSIKGYAEALMDTLPAEESFAQSRTFLGIVLKNAEYMMKLVERLLKLAEVEAASWVKYFKPVNLAEVAAEAWDVCRPMALGKKVELEKSFTASSFMVNGYREQLLTVFQNLYENALRYQPSGVPLKLSISSYGDEEILVCLEDKGPGIDKAHRERIFERFYRVERGSKKEKDALQMGLGLAICKHIVKNHGGKIWVEGEKGARFCFTLLKI